MKVFLVILLLGLARGAERDWWERGNFYQIYPRSWKDSDGDGVGDLKGITSKLQYLKDIGMNGVWLSPIFKSPMADFGYDISNYTDVHYEYGTLEDMDKLIKTAKNLGIKVILDFVPNHTSDEHPWFIKSEARDPYYENFYVWQKAKINATTGEKEPPNNWNSLFRFSAWQWSEKRQEYYLHQCMIKQPDLNFREPKVREAMKNVLLFWLNRGIEGFRIDAIPHIFEKQNADGTFPDEPKSGKCDDFYGTCYHEHIYTRDQPETYELVYEWRELLENYTKTHGGSSKILMTEAYATLDRELLYYGNSEGRKGSQIPFNFEIISYINANSTPAEWKSAIDSWLINMPKDELYVANWLVGNHDNHRSVNRLGINRGDLLNILVQTLPGIAITYYGEEIAMQDVYIDYKNTVDIQACNMGPENFYGVSRDPARTPFQWDGSENAGFSDANKTWLPVSSDYQKNNVRKQLQDDNSHLKIFKSLIRLRRHPVLREGSFESLVDNNLLIYKREYNGKRFFVILNLGVEDQNFSLSEHYSNLPNQLYIAIASMNSYFNVGQALEPTDKITIKKDAAVVLV